ncbi:hypothetical protein L1887_36267 [Cichorium endivia]|nr:hypothetical protein L1887_36267 [Cichorium endivia]
MDRVKRNKGQPTAIHHLEGAPVEFNILRELCDQKQKTHVPLSEKIRLTVKASHSPISITRNDEPINILLMKSIMVSNLRKF